MAKACPLKPTQNRVVLVPVDPITKTPGGIELPQVAQEKINRGTVVAVGPGKPVTFGNGFIENRGARTNVIDHGLKVGDEVIYSKYAINEVEYQGTTYLIVDADNVLAGII